ncbi:hypothetical protein [Streptomyces cadmiisoli]|uniref:hypothetical protein n=1 Tax=Streptomyces cadmiisoli TaxID=2184053 RepID=UPI003D728582
MTRQDPRCCPLSPQELQLRLTGPDTDGGALRFQWGDALLQPVEHLVSVAAGTPVQLELTGISTGSTIVHARPVTTPADDSGADAIDAPATSAASTGLGALTTMLDALESERDIRDVTAARTSGGLRRRAGVTEPTCPPHVMIWTTWPNVKIM